MKAFARALIGAAVFSAGVAQAAELSGELEASYAHGEAENNNGNDFNDDLSEWSIGGRLGAQLGPVFVQGDAHYVEGAGYDPTPSINDEFEGYSFGAHAGYRTERFHVGGFYSYLHSNIIGLGDVSEVGFDTLGVEGQLHFENISLNAQAGWTELSDGFISKWHDMNYMRGGAAFFVDPNLRLSADLLYADGEVESTDEAPLWRWSVEARKRFADTPTSVFLRYEHGDFRNETEVPNDILEDDTFVLGVSFAFGVPTLQAAEREGASLSSPNALLRYMGYSNDFD